MGERKRSDQQTRGPDMPGDKSKIKQGMEKAGKEAKDRPVKDLPKKSTKGNQQRNVSASGRRRFT